MRLSPLVLMLGLAASSLAVPASSQRADDQINPQSLALLKKGEAASAAGKLEEADELLESALAADPKNRAAFVAMARVAMKQQLYGQAIRYANRALALEPTDRSAKLVEGEAMVQAGAAARANDTLAELRKLCGTSACPEVAALSAAIAKGPALASAKPEEGKSKN